MAMVMPTAEVVFYILNIHDPTPWVVGGGALISGGATVNGTSATPDISNFWTAALPGSHSSDTWLDGSLVKESRSIVTPLRNTDNAPHRFLRVIFEARTYSDGTSRLEVVVENTLDQYDATQIGYSVDIYVNSVVEYHHDMLTQYWGTRWRKLFAVGLTESVVTFDFGPFISSRAIPKYLTSINSDDWPLTGPNGNFTNPPIWAINCYDILMPGMLIPHMEDHGGRGELAPYPDFQAQYLVYQTESQRLNLLAQGDLSGSWPLHAREPYTESHYGTGKVYDGIGSANGVGEERLLSIDERPDLWFDGNAYYPGYEDAYIAPSTYEYQAGLTGMGILGSPLIPENAHPPSLAYIPYLVTGDRYYCDEMRFWAAYHLVRSYYSTSSRNGSEGLFLGGAMQANGFYQTSLSNEVRALGWTLRNAADPAAYLPDIDPFKTYITTKLMNNLTWAQNYGTSYTTPLGSNFESVQSTYNRDGDNRFSVVRVWGGNYVAWGIDRALDQGFSAGTALRDSVALFQINLLTNIVHTGITGRGWGPNAECAFYEVPVADVDTNGAPIYYTTWNQVYTVATTLYNLSYEATPLYGTYIPTGYAADERLMFMIGVKENMPNAQAYYDHVTNDLLTGGSSSQLAMKGANGCGWAIDFYSGSPPTMATTQEYLLGTIATLMTTELNSLASSSGLTAGAISSVGGSSGVFSNVAGTGLGGYAMGQFELYLAAPAGTLTAGTAVYVWFISQDDGTNFEDGGSSVIPARPADLIFAVRGVSTAQRIIVQAPLPPSTWYVLVSHNTGQTWNASGNTLKVVPFTNQMV